MARPITLQSLSLSRLRHPSPARCRTSCVQPTKMRAHPLHRACASKSRRRCWCGMPSQWACRCSTSACSARETSTSLRPCLSRGLRRGGTRARSEEPDLSSDTDSRGLSSVREFSSCRCYLNLSLLRIPYPSQFGLQYLMCRAIFRLVPAWAPPPAPTAAASATPGLSPLDHWLQKIAPVGVAIGADIALSNLSLVYITITLYTMCKSTTPVFVLIFAILFGLARGPHSDLLGTFLRCCPCVLASCTVPVPGAAVAFFRGARGRDVFWRTAN